MDIDLEKVNKAYSEIKEDGSMWVTIKLDYKDYYAYKNALKHLYSNKETLKRFIKMFKKK